MRYLNPTVAKGLLLCLASITLMACHGDKSPVPPIHLNPNMDEVNYIEAQEPSPLMAEDSPFFKDNRGMRPFVEGTLPFNANPLEGDSKAHLYEGKLNGAFVTELPSVDSNGNKMVASEAMLKRGQDRYNIYCVPCHDGAGTGMGTVIQRGMVLPPSFHEDRILSLPLGQIYDTITNGVRNMKGYRAQIPVDDRWAITSYLRALQLTQADPKI